MRKYKVDSGVDALSNLVRIENEIIKFFVRLEAAKIGKEKNVAKHGIAMVKIEKPFAFENEPKEKTKRAGIL